MGALFWIFVGMAAVGLLGSKGSKSGHKKSQRSGSKDGDIVRLEFWHFTFPDEYKCAACGRRFRKKTMICPKCGTRIV